MFKKGEIWAYPTDTSFGLGVRVDDFLGLENLANLKSREKTKYFSVMVQDLEMLQKFAKIPRSFTKIMNTFFIQKPRTAIFEPTPKMPLSKFWPKDKVAFRICTIPEISREIVFPITATSANISGKSAIYSVEKIREIFGNKVQVFDKYPQIPQVPASEIWDFTIFPAKKIR